MTGGKMTPVALIPQLSGSSTCPHLAYLACQRTESRVKDRWAVSKDGLGRRNEKESKLLRRKRSPEIQSCPQEQSAIHVGVMSPGSSETTIWLKKNKTCNAYWFCLHNNTEWTSNIFNSNCRKIQTFLMEWCLNTKLTLWFTSASPTPGLPL